MKRFTAAVVDVGLIGVATAIFYCVVISIWRALRNTHVTYMGSYSGKILFILYALLFLCAGILYFYFGMTLGKGKTVGKLLMQIQVEENQSNPKGYAFLIALLKALACIIYPITILWYFATGNMPYDFICKKLLQGK